MKKCLFTFVFIILAVVSSFLFPFKIASLKEVIKPKMIAVDQSKNVFISDQSRILVYSIDDGKLIREFGRKGEGPQEFRQTPYIQILPDSILLYTNQKYAVFKKNGELIQEKRLEFPVQMINFLVDRFIIKEWKLDKNGKFEFFIRIVDENLKKIKPIHKFKDNRSRDKIRTQIPFVTPLIKFQCYSNKIFLVDGLKGFYIEVFNHEGHLFRVIKRESPKIPISEADKNRIISDFKNNPFVKERWERLKIYFKNASGMFPEYFPAIKDFFVADNKIYVKTYKRNNSKEEFVILDLNGNFLKSIFLPESKSHLYSISRDVFYYLEEKEEMEEWELNKTVIK